MTNPQEEKRSAVGASFDNTAAPAANDVEHTRVINTLFGKIEKQTLLWMAARMPARVTPDTLTMVGLVAAFMIFFGYALTLLHPGFLWLSSLGFVLHWFGDSMDGTLARFRKIERPRYGFFVDHMLDTVSEVLIFLGLGISPYLRFDLALLALTAYLLLATYVYLATYVNGVFRISYARMGPTEARILGILANTIVFFAGNPSLRVPFTSGQTTLTLYDLIGLSFMVLVTILFIYNTINTALLLSREDRQAAQARRREARAARTARRKSAHQMILVTGRRIDTPSSHHSTDD